MGSGIAALAPIAAEAIEVDAPDMTDLEGPKPDAKGLELDADQVFILDWALSIFLMLVV
jgi:hypothetical protein